MPLNTRPGQDPAVKIAITHWTARFVANGVPLGDVEEIAENIDRWDEWCEAWSARAAVHETLALAAEEEGCSLSCSEHYTRAALCYHFGKFLFVHRPDEMREAHRKAVSCWQRALLDATVPGERVEVSFAGALLAGILRRPSGIQRPPVVLMVMGLDSAKEEMGSYEMSFLSRGLATLSFDGPGQGEAEYSLAIRPDYETPVSAMVKWLRHRWDVDADRVGLWGVSLGGYYAARAAAFEKRIKACVALAGPYDLAESWDRLPELTREAFRVRSHLSAAGEAHDHAGRFSLKGVAKRITCPLLVVFGTDDRLFPQSGAQRLAREAAGPTRLLMVEGADHVANNRWYQYRPQTADWLAQQLSSGKTAA